MPFDPLKHGRAIEEHVLRGEERKYYRFRPAPFYGGIATADCVGCNLRCIFCWSAKPRDSFKTVGRFYSPRQVAGKLTSIAESRGYMLLRISGNEPTLGWTHLMGVLRELKHSRRGRIFILETNGIVLGSSRAYAEELASEARDFTHVRVSLKGATPEDFEALTGAGREAFSLQLRALENLVREGMSCNAAVMLEFIDERKLASLIRKLSEISSKLAEVEFETLVLYPHVQESLKRAGVEVAKRGERVFCKLPERRQPS